MSDDKARVEAILRRKAASDAVVRKATEKAARDQQAAEDEARQVAETWPAKLDLLKRVATQLGQDLAPGGLALAVQDKGPHAPHLASVEITLSGIGDDRRHRIEIVVYQSGGTETRVYLPSGSKPLKELKITAMTEESVRRLLLDFVDEAVR
jgi:hypothetical protein